MSEVETATNRRRQQTAAARQAFGAKFSTPEEKSEHFRLLSRRSAEGRLVLSGEEASALVDAYVVLRRIGERALAICSEHSERQNQHAPNANQRPAGGPHDRVERRNRPGVDA